MPLFHSMSQVPCSSNGIETPVLLHRNATGALLHKVTPIDPLLFNIMPENGVPPVTKLAMKIRSSIDEVVRASAVSPERPAAAG